MYVVDPCFKDQFDVLHPTPEYLRLFEALPTSFVAPEERVAQVVNLLCTEMLQVRKNARNTELVMHECAVCTIPTYAKVASVWYTLWIAETGQQLLGTGLWLLSGGFVQLAILSGTELLLLIGRNRGAEMILH